MSTCCSPARCCGRRGSCCPRSRARRSCASRPRRPPCRTASANASNSRSTPGAGGTLTVPGAQVTLLDRAGNEIGTASGPPAPLTIAVPPGVDATQPLIATTRATLDEQWSRAPTVGAQGGRRAGAHRHARGRRRAGHGDAHPRLPRAGRRAGLRRSAAKRGPPESRRGDRPAHRQGDLCVRGGRPLRAARRRAALVGPRGAAAARRDAARRDGVGHRAAEAARSLALHRAGARPAGAVARRPPAGAARAGLARRATRPLAGLRGQGVRRPGAMPAGATTFGRSIALSPSGANARPS